MTAEKSGGGFKLSGEKKFVIDGHIADKLIVVARTSGAAGDTQGLSMFLVDADAKGVSITRTNMVDSRNAAIISLDGVEFLPMTLWAALARLIPNWKMCWIWDALALPLKC